MLLWRRYSNVGTVAGTIYKRHECEWILPQEVALHVNYNPRHVPALIHNVLTFFTIGGSYVHIYEGTRSDCEYADRRVFATYSPIGGGL